MSKVLVQYQLNCWKQFQNETLCSNGQDLRHPMPLVRLTGEHPAQEKGRVVLSKATVTTTWETCVCSSSRDAVSHASSHTSAANRSPYLDHNHYLRS